MCVLKGAANSAQTINIIAFSPLPHFLPCTNLIPFRQSLLWPVLYCKPISGSRQHATFEKHLAIHLRMDLKLTSFVGRFVHSEQRFKYNGLGTEI